MVSEDIMTVAEAKEEILRVLKMKEAGQLLPGNEEDPA